jgi:phage shock protein PspC (stress-responsive transcriptional regulator)
MTTTAYDTAPSEPASPRLERTGRYRGVCEALARTTGTDVVLWRVLFVVLCFFDGLGVVLYLGALVAIPERGRAESLAHRLLHGPDRTMRGPDVLLLSLLATAGLLLVTDGNGLFASIVLAAFAVLYFSKGSAPAVTTEPFPGVAYAPPAGGGFGAPAGGGYVPAPQRQRSALGSLTMGVALLVVGVLTLLGATGTEGITPEVVLASALAVVGAGLVVGAWWGRSPLLVVTAVLLGLALAATSVARPVVEAGVGDRTWTPTGAADYRLGLGEATLDLRNMIITEGPPPLVRATVDVGELTVIVPRAVRVTVAMHADVGEISTPGAGLSGLRLDQLERRGIDLGGSEISGRDVSRELTTGPEGVSRILVEADVRVGLVTVIRRG